MTRLDLSRMPRLLAKKLVVWTTSAGFSWPLVILVRRAILHSSGAPHSGKAGRHTLLALNPDRFRGDLEILAATGRFRVLRVPFVWQARFLSWFFPPDASPWDVFRPEGSARTVRADASLRRFLRHLLRSLYRSLGVDAVIGAAVHYRQDVHWGAVSDELGIPYIVLHRENLVSAPAHLRFFRDRFRKLGRFRGSYLIVHNQVMCDLAVEAGFAPADRVANLGAVRMDKFIGRLSRTAGRSSGDPDVATAESGRRPLVVLFSFTHGTGLYHLINNKVDLAGQWSARPGAGLAELFDQVHAAIGRLARSRPDVDIVVKPKWGRDWPDRIAQAMGKAGVDAARLPNLTITSDAPVHDLILKADVVCGFGSTTLLEAGIAGKPVIMPLFAEANQPAYRDYVHFAGRPELFDVAASAEELARLVEWRLENPRVSPECMRARREAFEYWVSGLDAGATGRYADAIERVIEAALADLPTSAQGALSASMSPTRPARTEARP